MTRGTTRRASATAPAAPHARALIGVSVAPDRRIYFETPAIDSTEEIARLISLRAQPLRRHSAPLSVMTQDHHRRVAIQAVDFFFQLRQRKQRRLLDASEIPLPA